MKWLPARAYDNGVYVGFSNPVGMDDDRLKNGCAMALDPFGDVVAECRELGEGVVTAVCTSEKLGEAGGYKYKAARRPELYGEVIGRANEGMLRVTWRPGEGKPYLIRGVIAVLLVDITVKTFNTPC